MIIEDKDIAPAVKEKRIPFLNAYLDTYSYEETLETIRKSIKDRKPIQHCVLNACKLYLLKKDPYLAQIVRKCQMVQADGASIVLAGRLLGLPYFPRITGIDLMVRILEEARRNNYRVFFLGGTQEVLDKAVEKIASSYGHSIIAGAYNGYFGQDRNEDIVSLIASSNADILLVGMNSPKKEYWLAQNMERLNVPFCMGVGGSFDVIAGKVKRAPRLVQNLGLEWLFRVIQEPQRLWRRYMAANLYFVFLVLSHSFKAFAPKAKDR